MSTKSEQGSGAKSVNEAQLIMTESKEKDPSCARLKGEGEPRSIIIELVAAMHRYEMNVDESPPFEHQQMIRRAEAFLSESSENTAEGEGEAPSGKARRNFLTAKQCAEQFRLYAQSNPSKDSQHSLNFCATFLDEFSIQGAASVSPNVDGASAEEKEK